MTLRRNNPFGEPVSLRSALDRLFEDSFVDAAWRGAGDASLAALDVYETPDAVVVTAALPGIKPEDVDITLTGQTLTLRGEFKEDESVRGEQYLYRERRSGSFARQLQLPIRVQGDRTDASFENGLLKLTIPKAEEVKPRQIRISAGQTTSGQSHSGQSQGGQGGQFGQSGQSGEFGQSGTGERNVTPNATAQGDQGTGA